MISKEFFKNADNLAEEKNISKEQIFFAVEKALETACKKNFSIKSCRVDLKPQKKEILLFQQFFIVSDDYVLGSDEELEKKFSLKTIQEAKNINLKSKIGQTLEIKVDLKKFNFYIANIFKNRFNELINNFQKENLFHKVSQLKDKIIYVKISLKKEKFYRVDLFEDFSVMVNKKYFLKNDNFQIGDTIAVYVDKIIENTKHPIVLLNRNSNQFIKKIFDEFVPEVKNNIIEIITITPFSDERLKIGVKSNDPQIDAIGSIIGENSQRINEINKILSNTKIDLFYWTEQIEKLIVNAFQPVKILKVVEIDENNKTAVVIVEDDHVSVAIGKKGRNIQALMQITNWHIDVKTASQAKEENLF